MQISKGVEWAVHAAALLCAVPEGRDLRADALARFHGVPAAYMAKQLQALSKAGLVNSNRGARGGYTLAKPPADISLLDILIAIEGTQSAFRCTEIRQNGPCPSRSEDCQTPCPIAAAFLQAEQTYRNALRGVTLQSIVINVAQTSSLEKLSATMAWLQAETGL